MIKKVQEAAHKELPKPPLAASDTPASTTNAVASRRLKESYTSSAPPSLQGRVFQILSSLRAWFTVISFKLTHSSPFIEKAARGGNFKVLQAAKQLGYDLSGIEENLFTGEDVFGSFANSRYQVGSHHIEFKNVEDLRNFLTRWKDELGIDISKVADRFIQKTISLALFRGEPETFIAMVRELKKHCTDSTALSKACSTQVKLAIEREKVKRQGAQTKLVQFLVEELQCNIDREKLLPFAIKSNNQTLIDFLLEKGADVNVKNQMGYTPLHLAVQNEDINLVRRLVEKDADVKGKNTHGDTPLHLAAQKENETLITLLLEKGADINAAAKDGNTPLRIVGKKRNKALVDLLLKRGADPDQMQRTKQTSTSKQKHLQEQLLKSRTFPFKK